MTLHFYFRLFLFFLEYCYHVLPRTHIYTSAYHTHPVDGFWSVRLTGDSKYIRWQLFQYLLNTS